MSLGGSVGVGRILIFDSASVVSCLGMFLLFLVRICVCFRDGHQARLWVGDVFCGTLAKASPRRFALTANRHNWCCGFLV